MFILYVLFRMIASYSVSVYYMMYMFSMFSADHVTHRQAAEGACQGVDLKGA